MDKQQSDAFVEGLKEAFAEPLASMNSILSSQEKREELQSLHTYLTEAGLVLNRTTSLALLAGALMPLTMAQDLADGTITAEEYMNQASLPILLLLDSL